MSDRKHKKRRCCEIFRKSTSTSVASSSNSSNHHQQDQFQRRHDLMLDLQQRYNELDVIEEAPEETINIETKFKPSEIQVVDDAPETFKEQALFRYNCPVCLRYFNTILVGKCCGNYLCHFCADDFVEMEKNREFGVRCPLCGKPELDLVDVDPSKEIKYYGDSFVAAKETLRKSTKIEELKGKQGEDDEKQENDIDIECFAQTDGNMKVDSMRYTVLSNKSSYFFKRGGDLLKPSSSMKLGSKKILKGDEESDRPFDSPMHSGSANLPGRNTFHVQRSGLQNNLGGNEYKLDSHENSEESKHDHNDETENDNSKLFSNRQKVNNNDISDHSMNNRDEEEEDLKIRSINDSNDVVHKSPAVDSINLRETFNNENEV